MSFLEKLKVVRALLPWKNSPKTNEKNQTTMGFDENKLISLKENFTGQKFQWVKTDRAELLGKLVKCRDIQPNRMGGFDVIFDDGSRVDSARLNSNLMMIHGEVQPLSRSEVEQISGPLIKAKAAQQQPQPQVKAQPQPGAQPTPQPQLQPQIQPSQSVAKPNMFSMFNSEETQVVLSLRVKLPDKKLLKMMYTSAEDKEKFLSELSEYLYSVINKQVIADSMKESLDPAPVKKKEAKPVQPQIEVREI